MSAQMTLCAYLGKEHGLASEVSLIGPGDGYRAPILRR